MVSHPELVSFILRSKNRKEILLLLEKESMYSGQIMKATGMYKGHVSRALKELEERKLIKCRNPDDRSFKFYTLTPLGKKVLIETKKI